MTNPNVARTILAQLGGSRFAFMVGAKNIVGSADALTFQFMRTTTTGNRCTITLAGDDTYTVRFWTLRGTKATTLSEVAGVYCEDLARIFSDATGLVTSLGRVA
jgi:hypothetical protein